MHEKDRVSALLEGANIPRIYRRTDDNLATRAKHVGGVFQLLERLAGNNLIRDFGHPFFLEFHSPGPAGEHEAGLFLLLRRLLVSGEAYPVHYHALELLDAASVGKYWDHFSDGTDTLSVMGLTDSRLSQEQSIHLEFLIRRWAYDGGNLVCLHDVQIRECEGLSDHFRHSIASAYSPNHVYQVVGSQGSGKAEVLWGRDQSQ